MPMGIGRGGEAPACALRRGFAALPLLGLLCALAAPAGASERVTVNTTESYVDPSISAAFVTTPTICTEPVGTQGTSPDGCNALGDAAVLAATGHGPDVYFEPIGAFLTTKNAFVPQNPGAVFGRSGFSQIFSQHKYDLFGRAEDSMGRFNRIEMLFLHELGVISGSGTSGQTIPGSSDLYDYFTALLVLPAGQTFVSPGSVAIRISELATWAHVTSLHNGGVPLEGGGLQWMDTWATDWYTETYDPILGPGAGALLKAFDWDTRTPAQKASFFLLFSDWVAVAQRTPCGHKADDTMIYTNCNARDAWMNQTVASYTQAWESLGGDEHFAQNLRSMVGYHPSFLTLDSGTQVITDFRLEQSVELSGAFTTEASDPGDTITPGDNQDDIAGRQTFQQSFASNSAIANGGLLGPESIGQMVAQDVNGYFSSCLNCDTAANQALGYDHAFGPPELGLTFMPYTAGWQAVPTITHAP